MSNFGTLFLIAWLVGWTVYYFMPRDRDNDFAEGLQPAVIACIVDNEGLYCDHLFEYGVEPSLFVKDEVYKTEVFDIVDVWEMNDKPCKLTLDRFTHVYAEENAIALPDSYTERWPKPENN